MANDFYNHGGYPATGSLGASASARAEFDAIMAGFDKLPVLAGAGLRLVRVNAGATALESTNAIDSVSIGQTTPAAGAFTTLGFNAGSVGSPGLYVNGDPNTGLYSPGADQLVAVTAGVARWTVGASGNHALAAPSGGVALTVNGVAGATGAISVTDGTVTSVWQPNNTSIAHIGTTSNHAFNVMTNNATRLAIAAAGNITVNAPSSGTALTVTGLTTANTALNVEAATAGAIITARVSNTSNTASSDARLLALVAGSSGGDAYLEWQVAGIQGYVMGIDNSDSDSLVIAVDGVPGTNNVLRITPQRNVTVFAPTSGIPLLVNDVSGNAQGTIKGFCNSVGGTVFSYMQNTDNTNSASAAAGLYEVGGPSAGDPYLRFTVVSGSQWAAGLDNSDADAFKISNNPTLGTNDRLRLSTGGVLSLPAAGATFDFSDTGATVQQINSYNSTGLEIVTRSASAFVKLYSANATLALQLTSSQQVDISAGSGKLLVGGHITRFESAEQTTPSSTFTDLNVSHGGSRVPDLFTVHLRCKTAELGYAVGDVVDLTSDIDGTTEQVCNAYANTSVVGATLQRGTSGPPAIRHKTTGTLTAVTAANWRVVFKCHWL